MAIEYKLSSAELFKPLEIKMAEPVIPDTPPLERPVPDIPELVPERTTPDPEPVREPAKPIGPVRIPAEPVPLR